MRVLAALLNASLVGGKLPEAMSVTGLGCGLALLLGRTRRWWLWHVPMAVLVGAGVAALVGVAVVVFRPFPDALPLRILLWIGMFVAVVSLAWTHPDRRWWRRAAAGLAVLMVFGMCAMKINAYYGYRPTLAAALGIAESDQIDLTQLPPHPPMVFARPHTSLAATWAPPADMPHKGRITTANVPGDLSHFPARPAWLYLPPAYLSVPRAHLPVLVLIPGQPGGPRDWLLAGRLASVMDAFAAAHHGLAPVVIIPDTTGSDLGNTLCLDSRLGNAETYLAQDVPHFLAAALDVDTAHLAIGGFSYGGTWALQLALRRPAIYPTFLDVSGQAQPTLGDLLETVDATFGGDSTQFRQVDPLSELATRTYPGSAGVIVVGQDDDLYRLQAEQVTTAARRASIAVTLMEPPGAHSWAIATTSLSESLPWMAGRLDLIDPVPPPGDRAVPADVADRSVDDG